MTRTQLTNDLRYISRLLAEGDLVEAKRQLLFLTENVILEPIEEDK